MTGAELAQAALELIGAYSPADGDVRPADQEVALRHANLMRKSWNAKDLALHAMERQSFTWTAAASSRTIGAAGQLVGTYPLAILIAKVIPAGATSELDVDILTEGQYADIPNKAQTAACFSMLRYERTGAAVGTITVWPVPTGAPTLLLHNKVRLVAIVADTEFAIVEEAELPLVAKLAKHLAPIFGKPWTQELQDISRDAWATYQSANVRIPDPAPFPRGFPGNRVGSVSSADYDAGRF